MLDFLYRTLTHSNFRRVDECSRLIRWLEPARGEAILDVGCGDGFFDYKIAQSGARVVGIDLDDKRLAVAGTRNKTDGIEYHRMDAEQLHFPDASFDKAISFCVIEHFRNDEKVLSHLSRVLKPGGTLVFSADSLTNPGITEKERNRHREMYAVNTFYTVDSVREKLMRAGFQMERSHYILSGRLTLLLVRISWVLDEMARKWPTIGGMVRFVGYRLLWIFGTPLAALSDRIAGGEKHGLTLLVRAVKKK